MARVIGVEEARAKLGELAEDVAADKEPVVLTKRGRALAVLVSRDDYDAIAERRRERARAELRMRLVNIRERVQSAGLDVTVVDEAIAAARTIE